MDENWTCGEFSENPPTIHLRFSEIASQPLDSSDFLGYAHHNSPFRKRVSQRNATQPLLGSSACNLRLGLEWLVLVPWKTTGLMVVLWWFDGFLWDVSSDNFT